jgi:hypothetical protein
MYLVDSYYGEVIDPIPEAYDALPAPPDGDATLQVDFRYGGETCLMLWCGRNVRVTDLHKRVTSCP